MQDTVKAGIVIGLLLHLLQVPFHYLSGTSWVAIPALLWLTQLPYMLPAVVIALVYSKSDVAQGILAVIGLTALGSVAICGART